MSVSGPGLHRLGATCLSLTSKHAGGGTVDMGTWNMEHGAHISSKALPSLPPPSYGQRRNVCSQHASPPLPFLPHRLAASYRSAPSVTPWPPRREKGHLDVLRRAQGKSTQQPQKFCFCIAGLPQHLLVLEVQASSTASTMACLLAVLTFFLCIRPACLPPAAACSMMPPCADSTASSDCAADLVYLMYVNPAPPLRPFQLWQRLPARRRARCPPGPGEVCVYV